MKAVKIIKKKSFQKPAYGKLRRTRGESEFWEKIALQQQVLLHAKNQT